MGQWAFVIQFIEALFKCIEDRRREEVEAGLNDPGRREYRLILRTLRRENDLHGQELFAEADEVFAALTEMDAEDIGVLLDKAEASGGRV
jgi:predicted HAD superfamily phosphohydrolase